MTVEAGKVVTIHYTLTADDGEQIDSSVGGDPMTYLHGAQNIVPGLEAALAGKGAGDHVSVTVPPAEGYGELIDAQQVVPRSAFPEGAELSAGMPLRADGPEGEELVLWIDDVQGDEITISENHPLAGVNLNFEVDVVSVRDATDEEKEQGHVND